MSWLQIKPDGLQQIAGMRRLQRLNLRNCNSMTNMDVEAIATISTLQ